MEIIRFQKEDYIYVKTYFTKICLLKKKVEMIEY